MFKKKGLILVVSMMFILTLMFINVSTATPYSSSVENLPEEIPRPESPFDFTKIRDVSKTEEFAAKHNLGRVKQEGLPFRGEILGTNEEQSGTRSYDTHYHWGTGIRGLGVVAGVCARHTVDELLDLGSGNRLLYAPTLKGPVPCPLEVGVRYLAGGGEPSLYVFDFYIGEFTNVDYTVTELRDEHYLSSQGYYEVVIIHYDDTWGVYLHDFSTTWWDRIYAQPNDCLLPIDGWDIYEVFFDGTWPSDTAFLKASEIMIYVLDPYYGFYWDYVDGWGGIFGPGYETVNWPGGFNVPHGWIHNYYEWWAGVGRFYCSSIDWEYTGTYGGGILQNPENILGEFPDGNYATLIDQIPESSSRIVALMSAEATGQIKIYCYSEPGYLSYMYIYVSSDRNNWYQVGPSGGYGVGQTSPGWVDIGYYSDSFRYIAVCGYYSSRPVYLYVDAVRVVP